MNWFMGIDVGSTTSKGILLADREITSCFSMVSGNHYGKAAEKVHDSLLEQARLGRDAVTRIVCTGHGNGIIPIGDQHLDAVRCCGKGIHHVNPEVRTVLDIQGQSIGVMAVDPDGRVLDLATSEKCATGSGIFVEVVANVLQIAIADVGPISLKSTNPIAFSTGCAVFGESEAVSRVAEGVREEDILAGVHQALANTILKLMKRVSVQQPIAICGGGGLNAGLVRSLEDAGVSLLVPQHPDLINAIGAAVLARNGA